MAEHKDKGREEGFKVIDRRPFTAEGELRLEIVEQKERDAAKLASGAAPTILKTEGPPATAPEPPKPAPQADLPKRSPAFENLVRMLGSNAAMVLGAYADPSTGQPMLDPDAARELIDMLDALHEKTQGNLAPEENELLLDLLGKLKMTFLEISQAAAQEAQPRAKTRG